MIEGYTELSQDNAYTELRRILLDFKCQILQTIPPEAIEVRQGSWLGVSPWTMAKHLRFRLYAEKEGTRLEGTAYWPMLLIASIIAFYTASFFLLGIVVLLITQGGTIALLSAPLGLVVLILGGIVIFLGALHIYSYQLKSNAIRKIMRLLKARGSLLHQQLREARLRKSD